MDGGRLRRARERAGLTQSELARRAGISRQSLGGAESGRHVPAVDAALRIAAALGEPVGALFGPPTGTGPTPPAGAADGTAVVIGRVGERLHAHALAGPLAGDGAWATVDGVVEGGRVRTLPGADPSALVVVGCDPALGLLAGLARRDGRRAIAAVEGTSGAARAALADGRAHAALVHGPSGALGAAPAGTRRVHLARWRVGLGVGRSRSGADSLDAVVSSGTPLIGRDPGAASQQALERALGDRSPVIAHRATGHVDAARRAAITGAPAVTFEPAARMLDLRFIPLETHAVELWIGERHGDHPGAGALLALLGSPAFTRRLALVGGYDLEGCGTAAVDR